jgi:hypothetical protein
MENLQTPSETGSFGGLLDTERDGSEFGVTHTSPTGTLHDPTITKAILPFLIILSSP